MLTDRQIVALELIKVRMLKGVYPYNNNQKKEFYTEALEHADLFLSLDSTYKKEEPEEKEPQKTPVVGFAHRKHMDEMGISREKIQ